MNHEALLRAIKVLYYANPLLTLLFYVVAAIVSVCTLQTLSVKRKHHDISRRTILWIMTGVATTYVRTAVSPWEPQTACFSFFGCKQHVLTHLQVAAAAVQTTAVVNGDTGLIAKDRNVR